MKATFDSVTENECQCSILKQAASNPDIPIYLDEQLNEYYLEYFSEGGRGRLIIYHCPFCGGIAAHSRRELYFTDYSTEEQSRIQELVAGLNSLEAVIARFGEPDEDFDPGFGISRMGEDGELLSTESYRTLVYRNLSATAEVNFLEMAPDRIGIMLQGKPIEPLSE